MTNNLESSSQPSQNSGIDSSPIVPQPTSPKALELIHQAGLQLGTKLSLRQLSSDLLTFVYEFVTCEYIVLFTRDTDGINFRYQHYHPVKNDNMLAIKLKKVYFNSFNAEDDTIVSQWLQNSPLQITRDNAKTSQVQSILDVTLAETLQSVPLIINNQLFGILLFKLADKTSMPEDTLNTLNTLNPHLAMYLKSRF